MKRFIIFLAAALLAAGSAFAQNPGNAKITFLYTEYNYGNIMQNGNGCCFFYYRNTGTAPLLLHSVTTSCGCTVPTWSKKPLLPGKTGKIKVKYNTSLPGEFRKIICVKSNAVNRNPTILRIHGKVLKK